MLIIFGGLPGVGKTTIAKSLVKSLNAAYLRVDTVEQVLKREAKIDGPEGYMVCWALAEENLKLGISVIADSVNGILDTRNAWKKVATNASVPFFEIELICSDLDEHQRRVEERKPDIINHQLPTWKSVKEREYLHWAADLILDTSKYSAEHAVEIILSHISQHAES